MFEKKTVVTWNTKPSTDLKEYMYYFEKKMFV